MREITDEKIMSYIPKKFHEAIEAVSYDSYDRYFIYLTDDYIATSTGCHTIHAYTLKELKADVKTIVKK